MALKKSAIIARSWKKLFDSVVIIPTEMRFCDEGNKEKCCDRCNNQIDRNKDFGANLNLMKRKAPNHFGHMLPYYNI